MLQWLLTHRLLMLWLGPPLMIPSRRFLALLKWDRQLVLRKGNGAATPPPLTPISGRWHRTAQANGLPLLA